MWNREDLDANDEEVLLPVVDLPPSIHTDSASGIDINLSVGGMTCTECGDRVQRAMEVIPGILECDTKFLSASFSARYVPSIISPEQIIQHITELGFSAQIDSTAFGSDLSELIVLISSSNPISKTSIEELLHQDGQSIKMIASVTPSQPTHSSVALTIKLVPGSDARILYDALAVLFKREGFDIALTDSDARVTGPVDVSSWTWRLLSSVFLSLPVMILAFTSFPDSFSHLLFINVPAIIWLEFVFAVPIQFVVAQPLYSSAYRTLIYSKEVEMNFLIVSSTTVAFGYSFTMMLLSAFGLISDEPWDVEYFYDTTAILITLIIFGRWMEKRVSKRTTTILVSLSALQASTALLCEDPGPSSAGRVIDVRLCRHGDILRVLPGAKIPLDGVVTSGTSEVDESMLSGEPFPILKSLGDIVHGGSINQSTGSFLMRVTHTTREGTLAQMHKLIEMSQSSKPALQRYVDRIASYFVRVILALSLICFIVWYLLALKGVIDTMSPFAFALRFAITVMIISCPCALALASPTAIMVASGVAAEHGVIFKSGLDIETASKITAFLFDKTGTLTTGQMSVRSFHVSKALEDHWIFSCPEISFIKANQSSPGSIDPCCSSKSIPPESDSGCSEKRTALMPSCSVPNSPVLNSGGCCSAQSSVTCPDEPATSPAPSNPESGACCASKSLVAQPQIDFSSFMTTISTPFTELPSSSCSSAPKDDQESFYVMPTPTNPADLMMIFVHLVESQSQHPIARALQAYTKELVEQSSMLRQIEVSNFLSVPGFGITGTLKVLSGDGLPVDLAISIGSWEYMQQREIHSQVDGSFISDKQRQIINEQNMGHVVFYLGLDTSLVGLIVMSDALKSEAIDVIQHLHSIQASPGNPLAVGILSGDSTRTTNAVASQLSPRIPLIVHAELTPAQKSQIIRETQEIGNVVGFIGDGINDAAALSQANLGFALADGTDLAMSSADVLLLKNDLRDVVFVMGLSRFTMKIIKINIWWGILYNIIAMPIALGLLWPIGISIPPEFAGFAELFSSIPVILFSLLIKRYQVSARSQ